MPCAVQWQVSLETLAPRYEHAGITTAELGKASKSFSVKLPNYHQSIVCWVGGRLRELVGRGSNWEGSCFWLDHGGLRLVPCMAAVRISLAGPAAGRDCHVVNLRALSGPSRSSLVGWLGLELLHLAGAEHQDEQGNMAVKPPVVAGANLRLNCQVLGLHLLRAQAHLLGIYTHESQRSIRAI
ncbi:uncharacterized protein TrAtP1_000553 [Trichoderma atroviride]|uniref:uncharacterized protein n=1 Tax=Hypocrea atroviridis TaxID=63577 RepID=UPI003320165E|nr:hypothetical protein TrAtP1_000553 [Trichoderma atroviride]